jgi:hypothetical protein
MKSFKQYISEAAGGIAPIHQHMNIKQMRALNKHKSFQNYISDPFKQVYARPDTYDKGPGNHSRNFVVSTGGNYRMHVAMTHHGKVLGHSIYRKGKPMNGMDVWEHVKTEDGK